MKSPDEEARCGYTRCYEKLSMAEIIKGTQREAFSRKEAGFTIL